MNGFRVRARLGPTSVYEVPTGSPAEALLIANWMGDVLDALGFEGRPSLSGSSVWRFARDGTLVVVSVGEDRDVEES